MHQLIFVTFKLEFVHWHFQVHWILLLQNSTQLRADGSVPKSFTVMLKSTVRASTRWQWVLSFASVYSLHVRPSENVLVTVFVRPANIGTTPWSVITAKFSSSLAMFAMAAHTLASTSLSSDFNKLTMSSKPPTKLRTISPASYKHHSCMCQKLHWLWRSVYT